MCKGDWGEAVRPRGYGEVYGQEYGQCRPGVCLRLLRGAMRSDRHT